jgi:hypothetical protein
MVAEHRQCGYMVDEASLVWLKGADKELEKKALNRA